VDPHPLSRRADVSSACAGTHARLTRTPRRVPLLRSDGVDDGMLDVVGRVEVRARGGVAPAQALGIRQLAQAEAQAAQKTDRRLLGAS